MSLVFFLCACSYFNPKTDSAVVKLITLDVGQGDAILIISPDGSTILIDGGPDNSLLSELGNYLPWWQRQIDYVMVTHPDSDHYLGLNGVAEKYRIKEFWYYLAGSQPAYENLLSLLSTQSTVIRQVSAGDQLTFPSGLNLKLIWPEEKKYDDSNSSSLVILLSWGETDVLLTGDAPIEVEQQLVKANQLSEVEILKVGHHGSRGSTSDIFLTQTSPELCLISVGANNRYNHPHPEVLKKLASSGCRVVSTVASGSISVNFTTSSWQLIP